MKTLISEVFELIKDYRADENNPAVMMTTERIKQWVEQFGEEDRVFLLTQLVNIFNQHYCTKENAYDFLKETITSLAIKLGYDRVSSFLKDSIFLDLQGEGKSQDVFIQLLADWLKREHDFDFSLCGTNAQKNFVYLDDVLCTGNTLFYDIKNWVQLPFQSGLSLEDALKVNKINIVFAYIFVHLKNYLKKKHQFQKSEMAYISSKMGQITTNKSILYRWLLVDNKNFEHNFDIGFLLPQEKEIFNDAIIYTQKVILQANQYADENEFDRKPEEFYRQNYQPSEETFFSSVEVRTRFENIMLKRGLEIIGKTPNPDPRMRPLGYALRSEKSFGFGALCFTWRNVPNTTPLAFWYLGGGNFPLFERNH